MIQSENSLDNVFQTAGVLLKARVRMLIIVRQPTKVPIDHTAKMKEAQLREKPERREWEAAPSFFKWTCGNYDHVLAARECEDFSEKLATAQSFRQAGNELYVEEKFEDALMKYAQIGWHRIVVCAQRSICKLAVAGIHMQLQSSTGFTDEMDAS